MNPKNKQAAIGASMMSGFIIALFYHFEILVASQATMILSMLVLSVAGIYFAYRSGNTQGIITFLLIGIIGCTIEGIGIATCRPYGCFQYSDMLGPKFLNTFPYLLMGVRPFIVISIAHLVPKKWTGRQFIVIGVLLLLFLDFALDPVHINQGIRSYNQPGRNRFGVPLQNFFGWIITGGLSMRLFQKRKNTITHEAWYYSGIAVMILFWTQFLLYLLG